MVEEKPLRKSQQVCRNLPYISGCTHKSSGDLTRSHLRYSKFVALWRTADLDWVIICMRRNATAAAASAGGLPI